jgi:hypothetical protein
MSDVALMVMWPPPSRSRFLDSDADRFITYPVRVMGAIEF